LRESLSDLLEDSVRRRGDGVFLRSDGTTVLYRDFLGGVNGLAGRLAAAGIGHGDRVCVLLPNGPELLYSWFALARLGAVMVPCNPALKVPQVEPYLRLAGVCGMVSDVAGLRLYAGLHLRVRVRVGEGEVPGCVPFSTTPGPDPDCPRPAATDLTTLLQTSGTTGTAKSAALSHASYVVPARELVRWMELTPEDRLLGCLPLFHMAGEAFAVSALAAGASLALAERFSASDFWSQVRRDRITVVRHLGEMLAILCKRPGPPAGDHCLRAVYGGGARPEVAEEFERRFGAVVVEGYGLTETNTVLRNELGRRRRGSIGRRLPHCEVRIADEHGTALPPSTPGCHRVGEIQVRRNPVMMAGYLVDGGVSAACLLDGWFPTGDLGYCDEDGYFFFVGRRKEIIRRRGENIAPQLIEEVLDRHAAVLRSAVVGVPDSFGGEEIKAYLVCRPGMSIAPDEIVDWCRGSLAEFQVPRYFELCNELPSTATNKIDKNVLRTMVTAGGPCFDRQAEPRQPLAGLVSGAGTGQPAAQSPAD
jgi:crotonobetaine/carnitine-CoA ligase